MATWRSRFLMDIGTHGFPSPDHSRFGFFIGIIIILIMFSCQAGCFGPTLMEFYGILVPNFCWRQKLILKISTISDRGEFRRYTILHPGILKVSKFAPWTI